MNMNTITICTPAKPTRKEAFERAREFIHSVRESKPTLGEIKAVYRATMAGGCIFFRCSFN